MGILHWLFGSDKNIKIPCVEKAEKVYVDFSGTRLQYSQPQNYSYSPSIFSPKEFNLSDVDLYTMEDDGSYAKVYARCSWNLYGRHCCGGITAYQRILYLKNREGERFSCFNYRDSESEILKFCHAIWGRENQANVLGDGGTGLILYPLRSNDIAVKTINGIKWSTFSKAARGKPPEIYFAAPLSRHHLLLIDFVCSAYDDVDYYSPVTNLKEACERFIDEYMQHVFLELSDAAKKERAEALEPLGIAGT